VEGTDNEDGKRKASEKMLNAVVNHGAGSDVAIKAITRFDQNVPNGILYTCHEHKVTDIILGVTPNVDEAGEQDGAVRPARYDIGLTTHRILLRNSNTVWIYNSVQPFNTLKKIIVAVNSNAEAEEGFMHWVNKIFLLSRETGLPLTIYADSHTRESIQLINNSAARPLTIDFIHFDDWSEFLIICRELNPNDLFIIVSSRKGGVSYSAQLDKLPYYLTRYFQKNSYILLYPQQTVTYSKLGDLHQEESTLIDLLAESRKMAGKAGTFISQLIKGKNKPEEKK
jgi:hypothetical protein